MGDYAVDALRAYVRGGIKFSTKSPCRRVQASCCVCGKVCRGEGGLLDHHKQKHGLKITQSSILGAHADYED